MAGVTQKTAGLCFHYSTLKRYVQVFFLTFTVAFTIGIYNSDHSDNNNNNNKNNISNINDDNNNNK